MITLTWHFAWFPPTLSPSGQTSSACSSASLTPHLSLDTLQKHFLKCIFYKANPSGPYDQGNEVQFTTKDIKKERLCMKSPTVKGSCAEGVFQIQLSICGDYFFPSFSCLWQSFRFYKKTQKRKINL